MPRLTPDDISLFRISASKDAQYLISKAKAKALQVEALMVEEGVDTYNKLLDMGEFGVIRIKRVDTGSGSSINRITCFTPSEAEKAGLRQGQIPTPEFEPVPTPFDHEDVVVGRWKEKLEIDATSFVPVEYYAGVVMAEEIEGQPGKWTTFIALYKIDFSKSAVEVDLTKPDYRVVDHGHAPPPKGDLQQIRDTFCDNEEFIIHRLTRKMHNFTTPDWHNAGYTVKKNRHNSFAENGCTTSFQELNMYRTWYYCQWGPYEAYDHGWLPGLKGLTAGLTNGAYFDLRDTWPHYSGTLMIKHCAHHIFEGWGKTLDTNTLVHEVVEFTMDRTDGNIRVRGEWGPWGDSVGSYPYGLPPTDWYPITMTPTEPRLIYWDPTSKLASEDPYGFHEFDMLPLHGQYDEEGVLYAWPGGPLDKSVGPNFWGRASFYVGNGQTWDLAYPWERYVGPDGKPLKDNAAENSPMPYGVHPHSFAVGMGLYYDDDENEHWGTTVMKFFDPDLASGYDQDVEFWEVMRDGFYNNQIYWCTNQKEVQHDRDIWFSTLTYETTKLHDRNAEGVVNSGSDIIEEEFRGAAKFLRIDAIYVKFPKKGVVDDDKPKQIPSVRQSYTWEI